MKKLANKLLRQNIGKGQLAGFILANILGMTIILTAVQFYFDVVPLFTKGDSFMRPGQIIIAKRVSTLTSLTGKAPTFSQEETKEIGRQPFTTAYAPFTPSQFDVFATIGSRKLGMEFSTEMFFEAIPDKFIDVDLSQWKYEPGSDELPIILPRNYLNLYNFGFAGSRGLPAISEGLVKAVGIHLILSGTAARKEMKGHVVAFSKRLNTILVPQNFMDEMNRELSPDRSTSPSRIIVEVNKTADENISKFLSDNNYDTESTDADAARTASLLKTIITLVGTTGGVITALAFYVLLLSIFLLLQKHTDKIDNLLLMGYTPKAVGKPYNRLALTVNTLALVVSLALCALARQHYLPRFGELYPKFEAYTLVPAIAAGLIIFALTSILNHSAIRRKIINVWHMHKTPPASTKT